jgi:rubrerythrin
VDVRDSFELRVGKMRIRVLETPGHTLESVCLVITDEEKSAAPWGVLTGDTLFLGDVGRPDLSRTHTPAELAGMLYDNLHHKLLELPDDVLVYPAHGAGSLCGRNMRAERVSTIGTERLTNYALQIKDRESFIRQLTDNLPARPEYFLLDAEINRSGAPALSDLPALPPISARDLKSLLDDGVLALDVRPGDQFAAGHVPGSVNIPLSGQFASWAGTLLGLSARPVLIAETDEQLSDSRLRLARVGIEDVRGFLKRRPVWMMRPLGVKVARRQAEIMEMEASRFYSRAASRASDVATRELLNTLADEERKHTQAAGAYEEKHLTEQAKDLEKHSRDRLFMLQYVQPGLAGLMDGSVSTLAPLFAAAFATHKSWEAFLVGMAASIGAGISMGFAESLSDDGSLTGRGSPWIRGTVTGLMTTAGGLGHTLPFLIPHFQVAMGVAILVVAIELGAISYIRHRYMDTPFLQAAFQVVVGGILVFLTGWLIGSS